MKRSVKLIFIIFISVLFIFFLSVPLFSGDFSEREYLLTNDVYDTESSLMTETQYNLIKAGISSSSGHNMQPWKVRILNETSFSLHIDKEKELAVIDPENTQLLMSQGTFIASVIHESEILNVQIAVLYPEEIDFSEDYPLVATFTISGTMNPENADTTSGATVNLIDNAINENQVDFSSEALQSFLSEYIDIHSTIINEDSIVDFQSYLLNGTVIESQNQSAMEEMLSVFRFSRKEKNEYRYGLSLNTIKPPFQFYAESFIGWTTTWDSFGKSSITQFEKRLEHEFTYIIFSKENPSFQDYIEMGFLMQMLSYKFSNVYLRPAAQLIEPLEGMEELNQEVVIEYHLTGTMMMIVGLQEYQDTFHESIRHHIQDIIIE